MHIYAAALCRAHELRFRKVASSQRQVADYTCDKLTKKTIRKRKSHSPLSAELMARNIRPVILNIDYTYFVSNII